MKIENIRLEVLDKGSMVTYNTEEKKLPSNDNMCHRDYQYKKEVFSDDDFDKSVERIKELKAML